MHVTTNKELNNKLQTHTRISNTNEFKSTTRTRSIVSSVGRESGGNTIKWLLIASLALALVTVGVYLAAPSAGLIIGFTGGIGGLLLIAGLSALGLPPNCIWGLFQVILAALEAIAS